MNKTIAIVAATGVLMTGTVTGCASAAPSVTDQAAASSSRFAAGPRGSGNHMGGGSAMTLTGAGVLTTKEKKELKYLVEEEKVAHDLYVLAYDTYGLRVFSNIAASETRHQQAMERVLAAYNLKNPSRGLQAGQFSDPALQALYDSLEARVATSQDEALAVGVAVEKADIADLRQAKSGMPKQVRTVLGQLLAASKQHLRAFTAWSR